MRHFCDNCAQDFGPFVQAMDYVVHTEKVWLCSLVCLNRLERVWAPKNSTFLLSHFTEGPSPLDVVMTDNADIWSYEKTWNIGLFDFLAVFSVSLGIFWAYLCTLYALLDSLKGF